MTSQPQHTSRPIIEPLNLVQTLGWGLSFNALWFTVIWLASDHQSALAGGLCALWTLALIGSRPSTARRPLCAWALSGLALGYIGDGLSVHFGLYQTLTSPLIYPAPLWLLGLWLAFSALAPLSLSGLLTRPPLAVALGLISGPMSYLAGVKLDAMRFGPSPTISLCVTSILWGGALYLGSRAISKTSP